MIATSHQWQHMTTFTLGLGAQGKMLFSAGLLNGNYWNVTSGDFYSVKTGRDRRPGQWRLHLDGRRKQMRLAHPLVGQSGQYR